MPMEKAHKDTEIRHLFINDILCVDHTSPIISIERNTVLKLCPEGYEEPGLTYELGK